ncbi:response regulator [candidate division KSB1 bacterium]
MKTIKGKVMIIDSDLASHEMMIEYLKVNGYFVLTAANRADAQQKINHNQTDGHPIDIVILEYELDEKVKGPEFIKVNYDKNIEFIGISPYPEKKCEFFAAGASGFLTKPIDFLALTRTVITLMDVREKLYQLVLV